MLAVLSRFSSQLMVYAILGMLIIIGILGYMVYSRGSTIQHQKQKITSLNKDKAILALQREALVEAVEIQNNDIERIRINTQEKLKNRKVVTKTDIKIIYHDRNITVPSAECTEIANHIDSIREMGL